MAHKSGTASQEGVRRGPSKTQPQVAHIWDRNPMSGPWCVAVIDPGRTGSYAYEGRLKQTRLRRMAVDQCSAQASVSVDGEPFCKVHAGLKLLEAALGDG